MYGEVLGRSVLSEGTVTWWRPGAGPVSVLWGRRRIEGAESSGADSWTVKVISESAAVVMWMYGGEVVICTAGELSLCLHFCNHFLSEIEYCAYTSQFPAQAM